MAALETFFVDERTFIMEFEKVIRSVRNRIRAHKFFEPLHLKSYPTYVKNFNG